MLLEGVWMKKAALSMYRTARFHFHTKHVVVGQSLFWFGFHGMAFVHGWRGRHASQQCFNHGDKSFDGFAKVSRVAGGLVIDFDKLSGPIKVRVAAPHFTFMPINAS
jgi:hypothetical protein